jgi:uncharacterized protein (UPF0333 family)
MLEAPIIIVVGIGIYGASFIERSIVESRNSALTLITETRKEARNDLDNQIKAFNDMTTATSAQIANIAKMQDLQQQVSSQLNAATDARLAAQKAEQDALTKKREAEDQVRSLEDQVKFLNDKANSLQEQVQAALLATQHVVPVDVQERKVKLNKFVRQVATAGKKDQLDAIAKSLQLPIVSDPKEERNNILLEVDKRVVDSNSMDELAKLLHDTTGQDF